MPYVKQVWIDHSPANPASAARFGHIEDGVFVADAAATAAQADVTAHEAATTSVHGISNTANLVVTSDTRIPTQGENDALVGTSGTPGSGNKYVTDADSRLVVVNAPLVNVKGPPYNAVGDGTTDDRAAIQAAIDAAGGNPVLFPHGAYAISSGLWLRPNTRLVGYHAPRWFGTSLATSIIMARTGFSGDALLKAHDPALTGLDAANGGLIQGLCLNGNGGLASAGLWWYGQANDWTIRDVEVFGASGHGIISTGYSATPNQELDFIHCNSWNNGGSGWYFGAASYDHRLHQCVSHNNAADGFHFDTGCASIQLSDDRAEWNGGKGYELLSGDKMTLVGCVSDRNSSDGFYVQYSVGGPCLLSGCFANRDLAAGLRVHASNIVHVVGFTTRVGRNDDGTGSWGPIYGIDGTGASMILAQGFLQGTTAGGHSDGAGGQVWKWSGTTGWQAGNPSSGFTTTWQAATS